MFDSTISYASTSTYDLDMFLRSGKYDIDGLRKKFIMARETIQRVNMHIVEDDNQVS